MQTATHRRSHRLTQLLSMVTLVAILATACGSDGGITEPAEATDAVTEPAPAIDFLSMEEGENLTFAVEVTVTESPSPSFSAGEVLWKRNCYKLSADGSISGPGLPEWSSHTRLPDGGKAWAMGTWENEGDGTSSSYTAVISDQASLTQHGSITMDEAAGELLLTADSNISIAGNLLMRITATGHKVRENSCGTLVR